jgi:hypothetical protein
MKHTYTKTLICEEKGDLEIVKRQLPFNRNFVLRRTKIQILTELKNNAVFIICSSLFDKHNLAPLPQLNYVRNAVNGFRSVQ